MGSRGRQEWWSVPGTCIPAAFPSSRMLLGRLPLGHVALPLGLGWGQAVNTGSQPWAGSQPGAQGQW